MRTAVVVLIILNLALALMLRLKSSASSDPAPMASLNSQKITIVSFAERIRAPASCVELGPFSAQDAVLARRAMERMSLGDRLASLEIPLAQQWWVYIASRGSALAAQRLARELDKLGVKDYHVFDENSPWKHSVSLGVFKSADAAEKYLDELKQKGVRSARIEARRNTQTMLYVRDANPALMARLTQARAQFNNADLRQVNCPRLPLDGSRLGT